MSTPTATERVRATHLNQGDRIMIQIDSVKTWKGDVEQVTRFSGNRPPRRAFWAAVADVERIPGRRSVKAVVIEHEGQRSRITAAGDFAVTRAA